MTTDIKDFEACVQNAGAIGLNHNSPLKLKYKLLFNEVMEDVMTDTISEIFLEIASEQRLKIIVKLSEKGYKISTMAKELHATMPEIHRNFNRLKHAGLIEKTSKGDYTLTVYGKLIRGLVPTVEFMEKNNTYFKSHNFGNIPEKFASRVGDLKNVEQINGYIRVMDKWKEIYENSEKFINNILIEVSYAKEISDILLSKLEKGIKINSLFLESAIVSSERKKVLGAKKFTKFVSNELISRKMDKNIQIVVVLNEVESGISFPSNDGTPDLSKMLYSKDPHFCEWCLDFFNYSWKNASSFQQSKLKS